MRFKGRGLRTAGILLMFACYILAVRNHGEMAARDNGTATAVLEGDGVDARAAQEARQLEQRQKEPADFTIWGEEEKTQLENKELGQKSLAAAIYVSGSPQLLFWGTAVLDTEDQNGCLMDEETAEELFGSADVVGQRIYCQGRELTVRGILSGKSKVVVFKAGEKSTGLDHLTVRIPQNTQAEAIVSGLLVRHGLDGQILDMGLLEGISGILILILPLCAAVKLVVELLRYAAQEGGRGISAAVCRVGAVAVLLVSVWGISRFVTIPGDMIPTKWSDFDFWAQLFKEKEEAFLFLIQSAKKQPQMEMILAFFRSASFGILAILLYLCSSSDGSAHLRNSSDRSAHLLRRP